MLLILILMIAANVYSFIDVPSTMGNILTAGSNFSSEQPDKFLLLSSFLQMRALRYKVVINLSQISSMLEAGFEQGLN